MSSWRLTRNHEVIQERIAKLEKRASIRTFAATLGFTLLFGTIAWGTSWHVSQSRSSHTAKLAEPIRLKPERIPTKIRQIRLIASPKATETVAQHSRSSFIHAATQPPAVTDTRAPNPQVSRPQLSHASDTYSRPYPLSAMLKSFKKAKQAHEDGNLKLAAEKFLIIAREPAHPSLGPESYLRAIAIQRELGKHQEATRLMNEAKLRWPELTERSLKIHRDTP